MAKKNELYFTSRGINLKLKISKSNILAVSFFLGFTHY